MRVLNLGKVTSVPKLNEKKAIETGAQVSWHLASVKPKSDFGHTLITFGPHQSFKANFYPQLLSEIILIGIGSAIVIWEYRRSSAKDEAKAEAAEREKEEVRGKITDLEFIVARQSVQIKELTRYGHYYSLCRRTRTSFTYWMCSFLVSREFWERGRLHGRRVV